MAEKPLAEIVKRLKPKPPFRHARYPGPSEDRKIRQRHCARPRSLVPSSFLRRGVRVEAAFSEMTKSFFDNQGAVFIQRCGIPIVVNPPAPPLSQKEFDAVCELPFTYAPHPSYKEPIPAWEQIKDSFTVVRGCFGGCNFCGLGLHQGKTIQSRSKQSVARKVKKRAQGKDWKGVVSDLGGPQRICTAFFANAMQPATRATGEAVLFQAMPSLDERSIRICDLIRRIGSMHEAKHVYVNSAYDDLALLSGNLELLAQTAVRTDGAASLESHQECREITEVFFRQVRIGFHGRIGLHGFGRPHPLPDVLGFQPGADAVQRHFLAAYAGDGVAKRALLHRIHFPAAIRCVILAEHKRGAKKNRCYRSGKNHR